MGRPAGLWILMGIFVFTGLVNLLIAGAAAGAGGLFGMGEGGLLAGFRDAAFLDAVPDSTIVAGLTTVGLAFAIMGVLDLAAAWGIWNAQNWGWVLGTVMAVVGLLFFPVGTLLAIVTLVYLVAARPIFRVNERVEETREERPGHV